MPESSRIGEPPVNFRRSEQPIRADFLDLLALEENGGTEYICKAGRFDLSKILQIMPREARPAYQLEAASSPTVNVNVSPQFVMPENKEQPLTPEKPKPVLPQEKPKLYQQWWFVSIVVGLVFGLAAGLYFWNAYVGIGVFALVSFLVSRFNRKRRFFSAAWTVLSCLVGVNALPYIESQIDLSPYLGAQSTMFFKLDAGQTPALSISLAIVTAVLFILDYFENKR